MPSGALTLIEAAKAGDDQHKMGVVETIIQESPMIDLLPWQPFAGTALQHMEEGTLPTVDFRRVNEGYTPSFGTDNDHFWGVAILGGEVKVDKFLVNVTASREDLEAKQWAKLAKANSLRFTFEAFRGTGSAASKGFKGINALVDEGFGFKVENHATGGPLDLDSADEAIDTFRNQGGPQAALMNRTVRRAFTKAARVTVTGVSLIDIGTDVYGRQTVMYDGVPFVILGDAMDASGNIVATLPFDEGDNGGTGGSNSSIYWTKFGEDDVCGLLGKGGSFEAVQFGELESGPQRLGRMEWYPGIAIFNQFSIVRQTNITATLPT